MPTIRVGVIGAGRIAGAYVQALKGNSRVQVTAIASREKSKADEFARRFELPKPYGSYQDLLRDDDIDAVYIATPNGAHKEWSIKAAKAGKHVLCEKPLALTTEDAREMFGAAEQAGVVLIEAFPFRFQPQTLAVLEQVRSGVLGEIVTFTGCFGFRMRRENDVRLEPDQGGGSLWDVGVYPINLARAVLGKPPKMATATGKLGPSGVDLTATAVLEYEGGRSASIWSSFETTEFRRAVIVGTEGAIEYGYANHTDPYNATYSIRLGSEPPRTIDCEPANGFVLETNAFADLIERKREGFAGTSEQETIENIATTSASVASLRSGRPEQLARR